MEQAMTPGIVSILFHRFILKSCIEASLCDFAAFKYPSSLMLKYSTLKILSSTQKSPLNSAIEIGKFLQQKYANFKILWWKRWKSITNQLSNETFTLVRSKLAKTYFWVFNSAIWKRSSLDWWLQL